MNIAHVIKLLDIANNHLPLVESKYESLMKEIDSLEKANMNLARTCQQLRDDVSSLNETIGKLQSTVDQLRRDLTKLNFQKLRTEKSVKYFQNNNEMVVKIRQMARQELESFMPNPKRLLRAALISIFQSSRNHHGKLIAMSYNLPSNLISESFIDLDERYPSHHNYLYNADASFENFLLDQAEELYNKIIDDITNKSANQIH
jgi:alanyl-tRNA synthetase